MASELTKEEQERKLIEKFDALNTKEKEKWQREIEQLEQRTIEYTDLDIGSDVKIAIYARLNERRKKQYVGLVKELKLLGVKKEVGIGIFKEDGTEIKEWRLILNESDEKRAEEIAYEIMAFATVNPLFTAEWFRDNQDKFAMEDLLNNIYLYYNLQAIKWIERAENTKSFRTKSSRAKLR